MRQRHTLIARVMQMRQRDAASVSRTTTEPPAPQAAPLAALEARIAHLEQLVEGLQDSIHRESTRQRKQLAELESRLEPAALAVALSRDTRERGL
jgi:uncharacterized coiled-coil protein SlyX